jgi:Protein involved in formate dehydrogenase formation
MERLEAAPAVAAGWEERRRRAIEIRGRWPHAEEMLRLYVALLDPQERAYRAAAADRPPAVAVAAYVAERVGPAIVEATEAAGPPLLAAGAGERLRDGRLETAVRRWLAEEGQDPVAEFLARAASAPVLEAIGPAARPASPIGLGRCPRCGGRPQLSYLPESGESLLTAPRRLLCCRCAGTWTHERMSCPACGEQAAAKLPIFSDDERLPHLRAEACESCRCYLIAVSGRREPAAVPLVDELVALPLDLYVQERGFAKVVPNLMGI